MQKETAKMQLTLKVNGKDHRLSVRPEQTLLGVLRDDLGLTGTKQGCDDGACGTCMVTVNGAMARACRVPVEKVNGKDVLTIEGLGTSERLHPLQEAFIEADAVQCGFCTPGTIMAAKALLDRNPSPTREQIAKALGSNLCRCTGYVSILDAVARAAELAAAFNRRNPKLPSRRLNCTGGSMRAPRCSAPRSMPPISRCPACSTRRFCAARIRTPKFSKSTTAQARALPGVVAVVTARDVPGRQSLRARTQGSTRVGRRPGAPDRRCGGRGCRDFAGDSRPRRSR